MADFTKELDEIVTLLTEARDCNVEARVPHRLLDVAIRAYAEAMSAAPVAWRYKRSVEQIWHTQVGYPDFGGVDGWDVEPLYTAPPVSAPAEPVAVSPRLIEAAKAVEAWWLEIGMKRFTGAPYAMFALRSALVSPPASEIGEDR